ncbi:MAG: hypothetical protein LBV55_01000, partial [Acholeplasmatales bacterium]|nr:hypothetical protein [Acholeplasmatales bacterium]
MKKMFKKLLILLILVTSSVLLLACKNTPLKVEIAKIDVYFETIDVEISISDEDLLVMNSLFVRAWDQDADVEKYRDSTSTKKDNGNYSFSLLNLVKNTAYVVEVHGTLVDADDDSLLASKEVTTQNSDTAIEINNLTDFMNIKKNPSQNHIITADIDFQGYKITAEEFFSTSASTDAYKGHLDGQGHTLKNITLVTRSNSSKPIYFGLFGYINADSNNTKANIKDLVIENFLVEDQTFSSTNHFGFLAGRINSSAIIDNVQIINANFKATYNGNSKTASNIGGVVGWSEGKVANVKTTNVNIDVQLSGVNSINIGGIVGFSTSSAAAQPFENLGADTNISFDGLITSNQAYAVTVNLGGVIGSFRNQNLLNNLYATGDIIVKNFKFIGREGVKDSTSVNNEETLRVGGLVAEYTSGHPFSNGFSSGSIEVNVDDLYERIENVFVGALIALANSTASYSNLVRYQAANTTLNTLNIAHLFVGLDDALNMSDASNLNVGTSFGFDAAASFNGLAVDQVGYDFTPFSDEFFTQGINDFGAWVTEVNFDTTYLNFQVRIKNNLNIAKVVKVDLVETLVDASAVSQTTNLYTGSNLAPDYIQLSSILIYAKYEILVYVDDVLVHQKTFTNYPFSLSMSDLELDIHEIKFNATINDPDNLIKENTLGFFLYDLNGRAVTNDKVITDGIKFSDLSANTTYRLSVNGDTNEAKQVLIHQEYLTTPAVLLDVNTLESTLTKVQFEVEISALEVNPLVSPTDLKAELRQNDAVIGERKTITPATLEEFLELSPNTVYVLYIY